jgi:hypothetical protein
MVQNTAGCSAGTVVHTVMPAADSSMSDHSLCHCSPGGLHSMVTLKVVCTIYIVAAEADVLSVSETK